MKLLEGTDNSGGEDIPREKRAGAQVFYEDALGYVKELGGIISVDRRQQIISYLCELSLELARDPHPSLHIDQSERGLLQKGELSRNTRLNLKSVLEGYLERNSL